LATEGCGSGNFVYFVDAVILPHLIQRLPYSTANNESFEGKLEATDHGNRDEAVMIHTF
jgi:hypothetical protein